MRFRAKFSTDVWVFVVIACVVAVLWACNLHSTVLRDIAILYVLLGLQQVLKKVFTYWDLDSASFRERRLWKIKEIPWQSVTHVGELTAGNPSPAYVTIGCDHRAPMASQGASWQTLRAGLSFSLHCTGLPRTPSLTCKRCDSALDIALSHLHLASPRHCNP